jgi:hypothetical protein
MANITTAMLENIKFCQSKNNKEKKVERKTKNSPTQHNNSSKLWFNVIDESALRWWVVAIFHHW